MRKNKKKRSSKNLKINTRIVLTTVLAILIPLIIIGTFSTVFVSTVSSYFNFSTVTTNTYSTVNQIQWSQTLTSITNELTGDNSNSQKLENLKNFAAPLEKMDSLIYIENNNSLFYASKNRTDILEKANELVSVDKNQNLSYFGYNGLVLVNHVHSGHENYLIVIVNEDYTVNDINQRVSFKDFTDLLLGRTGIIVLIIILLFVVTISIISFITSTTIAKPIKKIAEGADEIARGNLDYSIEYDSTNELGKTVNSFNDMRLRLKESIEKQAKTEEERRVLVAGIAHDLRTPLTSAKGYAEGLLDGIADTPDKKERYIKTICQSINDTEKILDDLLTVSKLELNSYELNLVDVNATEFLNDGADEIKQLLTKADFDFEYECNCSEDAIISIDTDRFARVINNIISNSMKYAKENEKGKISLALNEYEKSIIIKISDNGIGVDMNSLPKIFDTMYRADKARTKVSDGSGLGLSICKQIVELHGGTIWASGKLNEGLSIFISLPKKEAKQ
ncbi:MAG: ATP-binding protein [Clostridium sp.]|nr:ATP-binding protein [Clostridium sp.]